MKAATALLVSIAMISIVPLLGHADSISGVGTVPTSCHERYGQTNTMRSIGLTANADIVTRQTHPTINQPPDIQYVIGSVGNRITWILYDPNPDYYQILRNGVQYSTGAWVSPSLSVSISVDGLSIGACNFSILAVDGLGNVAYDEVMISVVGVDVAEIAWFVMSVVLVTIPVAFMIRRI